MSAITAVQLLKKELNTKTVSEQIFAHEKQVRKDQEARQKVKLENEVKEEKTRLQIVRERRKKMEQECKKSMFLRKEKTAVAAIKQKKLESKRQKEASRPQQKTSFKSTLEKLHRRNVRVQMEADMKKKVRQELYKNHKLSKSIAKAIGI